MKYWFSMLLLLSHVCSQLHAQTPHWQWTASGYNTASAVNTKVCLDAEGNVFAVGFFTGSIQFPDTTYSAGNLNGMYIAKYDSAGKYLWSRLTARASDIGVYAITSDAHGNLYIGGSFGRTGSNGRDIQLPDTAIVSLGWKDIFLIQYKTDGTYIGAKTYGTLYDDEIKGMAIDRNSNLIIGGLFCGATSSPPLQESIQFGSITLTSTGDQDCFLVKFDSSGQVLWGKNPGYKAFEAVGNLGTDGQGNIYVYGHFKYAIYFDSIRLLSISQGNVIGGNFIAKYDPDGHVLWAKAIGGTGNISPTSLGGVYGEFFAVDNIGNAYVGGYFDDCTVIFDAVSKYPRVLPGNGECWFAKYSSSGQPIWAKPLQLGDHGQFYGMTCDERDGLYLIGDYGWGCILDNDTPYIPQFSPVRFAFIAKYDSGSSNLSWVQTAGGGGGAGAVPFGIAASKADEPVVVGQVYSSGYANFGKLPCFNYGSIGNAFVAKMAPGSLGVPYLTRKEGEVVIYPNPAKDVIHFSQNDNAYKSYQLYNALGQMVLSGKLIQNQESIILPPLAAGVYQLSLDRNDKGSNKKVFVLQ